MPHRFTHVVLAVLFAAAALILAPAAASGAAPVPFTDPHATAALGFCDKTGHEVRTGSTATAPFAWFAMSTAAVPAGYDKGKATLYAFQPIKNVDPGNWSGQQLTASSTFTNAAHPVAAGTVLDAALQDFNGAFPSKIDNLVQLRMYFNSPVKGQYRTTYPAAVVRLTGTTWTLVQGGGVPCTAGTGTSGEIAALPHSAFASASRPTPPADAPKAVRNSAAASPTGSATPGSATPTESAPSAATSGVAASSGDSSGGGSATTVAVIVVAAVILVGGGGAFWYLRRRPTGA